MVNQIGHILLYETLEGVVLYGGDVYLGDQFKTRIVSQGQIELTLDDNWSRTFAIVRHIPCLTRNMIIFQSNG